MLTDPAFPTPAESKASSFATSFMKNAGMASSSQRDLTKEALNCLRVLERILPVVFEPEFDAFEKKIMWTREAVEGTTVAETDAQPQFVIDDEEEEEDAVAAGSPLSPNTRSKSSDSSQPPPKTKPSLAEQLISCSIDLLFCCGFTLPTKIQVEDYKVNYVIWCVYLYHVRGLSLCSCLVQGRRALDQPSTQVRIKLMIRTRSKFCASSSYFCLSRSTFHRLPF